MLKLIKYEWLRKVRYLLFALLAIVILEGATLFCLFSGEDKLPWAILFIVLMFIGSYFVVFIDNIFMLSADVHKKSGYMLFMTPNSSYKIIGSKMIFGTIEAFLAFIIVYALSYLNLKVAYDQFLGANAGFQEFLEVFQTVFTVEGFGLSLVIFFLVNSALGWLHLISTVYFAVTLRKSYLANVKAGWFFTVLCFFAINVIQGIISSAITTPFTAMFVNTAALESKFQAGSFNIWDLLPMPLVVISLVLSVAFIVINYYLTCLLMDKKLEL